jgi:hypothetical protein
MENIKEKLKNKKKDIISSETEEPIKIEEPKIEPVLEEIKTEKKKVTFVETKDEIKKENNSIISAYINKLIFNIQLLFSMHAKLDEKLYTLLINYLSKEHLKDILEERDCKEFCGNVLCGKKLNRDKNKKLYYDSRQKEFIKEEIFDFFCDVRCMQKFKDAVKISQKFDYFTLARLDALCYFRALPDYFGDNMYISNIAKFSNMILAEIKKDPEELKHFEKKVNDYFEIDEKELDNITIS